MVASRYNSLEQWAFRSQLMLAVVFTDIVGSTSLRKELGDKAMASITQRHFVKARDYINQYDGYEIKTIGDEVMAVFPTAVAALNYVLDLYDDTGHEKIQVRAAIHVGTVSIVDGDIDATMVSLAARVSKLPRGATIYVTDDAQVQIKQVKSRRHQGFLWLKKKVSVKDFEEVSGVWTVRTPKMIEANRMRLATSATKPTPLSTVPERDSTISRRSVTLPPPPGAEATKGRFGDIGSLLSRPTLKPQSTPQPEWWNILLGNQDSRPVSNSLLAALLRNDEKEPKR